MSLRVWLPFNRDLNNQGLDELLFNNYNVTLNDSGKIGKCALFNGTSSYIQFTNWTINNNPQLSICFWVNSNRDNLYGVFTSRRSDSQQQLSLTDVGLSFRDTNHSSYTALSFTQPTVGTWTHYALIYDNGNWIIYKDGVEILNKTYSTATLNIINDIKIGRYLSSSYDTYFDGKLNDFRIYDHALSPAEVKEISRGLVLHYKLNHLPINNLIPFNLTTDNYTVYDYGNRTSGHISNNIYHVDGYQSTGAVDSSFRITSNSYLTLTANKDYYLSFYCKTKSDGSLYFTQSNYPQTGLIDDLNNKYHAVDTVTIGTDYDGWVTIKVHTGSSTQYKILLGFGTPNIYGIGSYIEFSKIILTTSLPDLESISYDSIIQDSSGYNNNGTVTGELLLNSEFPRYKNSTMFNGSSYIQTISPSSEVKSISLWAKWNSIPSGQSVVFVDYKSKIGLGLMSTGILCSTNNLNTKTFNKSNITANTWYHFVIVNPDNTNRDLYINGVKQIQTANTSCWTYTLDYFQLGKRSTTSDGFNGKVSDFRMYSAILSEEDVRQLYEVSGKIDNIGNIHSYELNEYDEGRELLILNLTSKHTSYVTTHLEYSSNGIEFPTGDSIGTEYIEINPTGNKYIYDFTVSVAAGDQFYIGFERFDANKTSRSNNACTYIISTKPATDVVKKRYRGTVNLKTDGVNPCKYIRLRILNGWSGSASDSTKKATVHSMSLREIPEDPVNKTKLTKTGVFKTDLLLEENAKVEVEKNLYTDINEFIEI